MATSTRSSGYKKKPTVEPASRGTSSPPPGSESARYHGDLTIPGYQPKTPTATTPYSPSEPGHAAQDFAAAYGAKEAHEAVAAAHAEARQVHAEAKQAKLVNRYVTKAYKAPTKATSPLAAASVDSNVRKATKQVSAARQSLLNHPLIKEANEHGKVIGAKGLAKITKATTQAKAIPSPELGHWTHNPNNPLIEKPKSDPLINAVNAIEKGGADVYRTLRQQQPDSNAAPHLVESEAKNAYEAAKENLGGAIEGKALFHQSPTSKDLRAASNIPAFEGAGKVAEAIPGATKAAIDAGKTGVTVAKALRHVPSEAGDVLRAAPAAIRGTPQAIKDALRASPDALKGAAKAAPKATGKAAVKGAVGTAENSAKAFSGISLAATVNRGGGGNVPIAQNLEALGKGTVEAIKNHPLETFETTGRVLPSFFTAPEAIGEAGVESALQGTTKPLTNTLGALVGGTKEMGEHLLSGNPKEVEKAVAQETGLAPLLPAPALLHAFHGSDLYTKSRGKVRGAVEDSRSGRRAKAVEGSANDGLTAPKERGVLGSRHEKNVLKPPVPVQGTGEHYVFRGLGEHIGAHKDRVQQALDATRASETAHGWNQIEMNRLRKAAHGAPPEATGVTSRIKGRLKGKGAGFGMSGLAKDMGRSYEALAPVLAKYGLPHSAEGVRLLEELRDYHGAPADITRPDKTINDRIATNEGTKRPEVLSDARHQNLTNELRAQQKRLAKELPGNYEPKPFRIQNDFTNHLRAKEGKAPILKDTERVTKRAEDILGKKPDGTKWHRDEAWEHYENLKASESKLRREARDARGRGDQAHADDLYKQARDTAKQRKALYGEISKFARHPGKIDTSSLKGSGRAMKRDFVDEQRAAAKELGLLEPVHIHDEVPRAPGSHSSGGVKRDLPGRVTHFSTGEIARSGEADARLESVLHSSAIAPRTQIALNDLIHTSVNDLKTPVRMPDGSYKHIATEAERKWAEDTHHMPAGTEWFPTPLLKAALNGAHNLSSGEALRMIDEVRSAGSEEGIVKLVEKYPDLRDEILGHNGGKGLTYTAIRSAGMDELVSQLKGVLPSKLRAISNVPSRLVLNDPAWVFAQLFATGIPIAAALGPSALIRAPQAIKAMSDIQKMDPASQARIKAMIGSSAGVMGTPHTAFSNSDPYAPARAIKHSGLGSVAWKLANGDTMGKWDRWNAAKMREFSATVRASKGFKNWYGGVKGLDKGIRVISDATNGMNAAQRLDHISKHPALARDLQKNMNKIGGNWNSFTKTERAVAPFAIFYPWIRYSTVWVLHTFPVNHPVAATTLAFLAQRNSNELQKIAAAEAKAGGVTGVTYSSPLENILAYANPVHRNAKNEPVENPSGSRMSPLGVFGQTVLEGNLLKTIGAANPLVNTGISLATNTNTFTGQKLPGHGPLGILENATEQGLSLSPIARQIESAIGFRGFNATPQSATSKAYEILAGGKGVKNLRSFADPYLTRPSSKGGLENALNTLEQRIGTTGHSAQSEAQGDESKTIQDRRKTVAKLKATNKKAWTEKEKLLRKIGGPALAKQSQEEYERYTAAGEEPGAGASSLYTPSKSKGSIYEPSSSSSSIYGGEKNNKALSYKPPSEALHLPSVTLPGGVGNVLGSIASPLTSLVGGTPAQAAELAPKQKAAVKAPVKPPAKVSPWNSPALQKRVVGNPTRQELIKAGKAGTLTVNHRGKILTPEVRKVHRELVRAEAKTVPKIEGFDNKDQQEFAQYLSKFTKIPPKLAGEWVKQEGGGWGSSGVSGGQAGEQNWLGVGYPAHTTPFSESNYFNHTSPKAAAKATAEWMEGKIGANYNYAAAPSIQGIAKLAKEGAPEQTIRSYIEGPSAWGTGAISQSGITVRGQGGDRETINALKVAKRNGKRVGLNPTPFNGDVQSGGGKTVTVRADAKGMVNWAKSAIGTQEGSPRQIHINAKAGISASEPWCAAFIGAGLERRGVPVPSNDAFAGNYLSPEWKAGTQIGTDLSKAKPGDVVVFGANEHIALYVGNGEVVAGNWGNEVARYKASEDSRGITGIARPHYRGGKIQIHEATALPGSTAPSTFAAAEAAGAPQEAAPGVSGTSTATTAEEGKKVHATVRGLTPSQKLKQIEGIFAGNLGAYGIPDFSTTSTSAGPSMATLSSDRQALGKL